MFVRVEIGNSKTLLFQLISEYSNYDLKNFDHSVYFTNILRIQKGILMKFSLFLYMLLILNNFLILLDSKYMRKQALIL